MKTFKEHLLESGTFTEMEIQMLNENLKSELTVEEEAKVNKAIKDFCAEYMDKKSIKDLNEELTNEGFLGSIFGGLTGFALGSSIGKIIANVLGIEKGVVFDLLTSRLVGAALGAAIGKRM
jgi:uncharacterized protein YcfJ